MKRSTAGDAELSALSCSRVVEVQMSKALQMISCYADHIPKIDGDAADIYVDLHIL